ncbi:hypothetical protein VPHK356_0125 [Vibrio phage K356]|nr:hypothetical protein MYOV002v2_p0118 [Vibrio phage 144E46.1]
MSASNNVTPVTIRPFTREDYYGFAGAEGDAQMVDFPVGSLLNAPDVVTKMFKYIDQPYEMYMTIDDNGSYVMWVNSEGECVQMFREGTFDETKKVAATLTSATTVGNLIDLGWSLPDLA